MLRPENEPMADNQSGEIQSVETMPDSTLESVDTAESAVLEVAKGIGLDEKEIQKIPSEAAGLH